MALKKYLIKEVLKNILTRSFLFLKNEHVMNMTSR